MTTFLPSSLSFLSVEHSFHIWISFNMHSHFHLFWKIIDKYLRPPDPSVVLRSLKPLNPNESGLDLEIRKLPFIERMLCALTSFLVLTHQKLSEIFFCHFWEIFLLQYIFTIYSVKRKSKQKWNVTTCILVGGVRHFFLAYFAPFLN